MVSKREAIQMAEDAELDLVCFFLSFFFIENLIVVVHNMSQEIYVVNLFICFN